MDVSLVISIVMAVIAICAACFSCWQARIAKATFKKTFSPHVIAFLAPSPADHRACHLVIKNIGMELATDIKINAGDQFISSGQAKDRVQEFLNTEIPFLEPDGERRTFIGFFQELVTIQDKYRYDVVTIKTKETGKEAFPISVHSFTATVYDSTNLELLLAKIAKSLDRLTKEDPA